MGNFAWTLSCKQAFHAGKHGNEANVIIISLSFHDSRRGNEFQETSFSRCWWNLKWNTTQLMGEFVCRECPSPDMRVWWTGNTRLSVCVNAFVYVWLTSDLKRSLSLSRLNFQQRSFTRGSQPQFHFQRQSNAFCITLSHLLYPCLSAVTLSFTQSHHSGIHSLFCSIHLLLWANVDV